MQIFDIPMSGDIPEFYSSMLIVKTKSVTNAMNFPLGIGPEGVTASPGLSMIALMERSGLVKNVIPLSRKARTSAMPMDFPMTSMMITEAHDGEADPNLGISMIQLDEKADLNAVQLALGKDSSVEFVSKVPVRYMMAKRSKVKKKPLSSPVTTLEMPPQDLVMWNLNKIRWKEARALPGFRDAQAISVAVLDTGIHGDHRDLAGVVQHYEYLHPDVPTASGPKDIVGHGTHVAGTIAAKLNNALGVNGICRCDLRVWKIFNDKTVYIPAFDYFTYVVDPVMYRRALAECLEENVRVINLSIGGPGEPDPQERELFRLLVNNGSTVVAAMGNGRQQGSQTSYPAAIPGVIAVGATTINDDVANFSNRGNHISISAPGVGIWSVMPEYAGQHGFRRGTGPGGTIVEGKAIERETDYDDQNGTSMASPHVAAAVALLLANKGNLSPGDVKKRLMDSADKTPGMGGAPFHPDYGAGRLNLKRLLS
jgi:subtilisin family serine protease